MDYLESLAIRLAGEVAHILSEEVSFSETTPSYPIDRKILLFVGEQRIGAVAQRGDEFLLLVRASTAERVFSGRVVFGGSLKLKETAAIRQACQKLQQCREKARNANLAWDKHKQFQELVAQIEPLRISYAAEFNESGTSVTVKLPALSRDTLEDVKAAMRGIDAIIRRMDRSKQEKNEAVDAIVEAYLADLQGVSR